MQERVAALSHLGPINTESRGNESRVVAQVQLPKWHPSPVGRQSLLVPTPSGLACHPLYPQLCTTVHTLTELIPLRWRFSNLSVGRIMWELTPVQILSSAHPFPPHTGELIQDMCNGTQKCEFLKLSKSLRSTVVGNIETDAR